MLELILVRHQYSLCGSRTVNPQSCSAFLQQFFVIQSNIRSTSFIAAYYKHSWCFRSSPRVSEQGVAPTSRTETKQIRSEADTRRPAGHVAKCRFKPMERPS